MASKRTHLLKNLKVERIAKIYGDVYFTLAEGTHFLEDDPEWYYYTTGPKPWAKFMKYFLAIDPRLQRILLDMLTPHYKRDYRWSGEFIPAEVREFIDSELIISAIPVPSDNCKSEDYWGCGYIFGHGYKTNRFFIIGFGNYGKIFFKVICIYKYLYRTYSRVHSSPETYYTYLRRVGYNEESMRRLLGFDYYLHEQDRIDYSRKFKVWLLGDIVFQGINAIRRDDLKRIILARAALLADTELRENVALYLGYVSWFASDYGMYEFKKLTYKYKINMDIPPLPTRDRNKDEYWEWVDTVRDNLISYLADQALKLDNLPEVLDELMKTRVVGFGQYRVEFAPLLPYRPEEIKFRRMLVATYREPRLFNPLIFAGEAVRVVHPEEGEAVFVPKESVIGYFTNLYTYDSDPPLPWGSDADDEEELEEKIKVFE